MQVITRFIATAVAAVALATSSLALAQDKVSLRLNWYLGGLHVPFYYGKTKATTPPRASISRSTKVAARPTPFRSSRRDPIRSASLIPRRSC